jgi:hypothetical protein
MMNGDRASDDGRVRTGRESGRDGLGVPHDATADTYGQADAGQGNWSDRGPAHPEPPTSSDAAAGRRLGQGAEPRGGAGGPADKDVTRASQEPAPVPPPRRAAGEEPMLASGLSNYSRTQYGNQGRYGTPAQYNEEPLVAGELQNGDHPEDRPGQGPKAPA